MLGFDKRISLYSGKENGRWVRVRARLQVKVALSLGKKGFRRLDSDVSLR